MRLENKHVSRADKHFRGAANSLGNDDDEDDEDGWRAASRNEISTTQASTKPFRISIFLHSHAQQ
jgi:hypothetical protein